MLGKKGNPAIQRGLIVVGVLILFGAGLVIGSALGGSLFGDDEEAHNEQTHSVLDSVQPAPSGMAVVDPPYELADFTLTNQEGEPTSLSDFRGRRVLLFFGYTNCPDVCPATLADFTRVKSALGDDADDVDFMFISVDGQRDTPERVAEYLAAFDEDFIGLTGDEQTLRDVGQQFGLFFQRDEVNVGHEHPDDEALDAENYFVQHTSPAFLMDCEGNLQSVFFFGAEPEVVTNGIQQLAQCG